MRNLFWQTSLTAFAVGVVALLPGRVLADDTSIYVNVILQPGQTEGQLGIPLRPRHVYDSRSRQMRVLASKHIAIHCGLNSQMWDTPKVAEFRSTGPGVTNEEECMRARGVVKQAGPEYRGKLFNLKNSSLVVFVDGEGYRRSFTGNVYNECGFEPQHMREILSQEIWAIEKKPDYTNAQDCIRDREASKGIGQIETRMAIAKGDGDLRYVRAGDNRYWLVAYNDRGYHIVTNCGIKAIQGGKGPRHLWENPPKLPPGAVIAGQITSENQCHAAMGHQQPEPSLAGQVLRGNSGDWNYFVDKRGIKHAILSGWPIWRECSIGQVKSREVPFDTIFRIQGSGELRDPAACNALAAEAGIIRLADQFKGKFVANCDSFKNTHVVGNDGKRYWIGNKDKWSVFEGCRATPTEDINCMSLNDVEAIPDGGPIGDINQCRALRGLAPAAVAPPPPPTVAQKFNGQFIANCDAWKHTHLVANGRRHWISNKDNWNTFNNCKKTPNEDVHCMSLADVNSVPDGGAIDLNTCRSLRGLPALAPPAPPPQVAPPPPPPQTIAQRYNGQFIANCDHFKNTHLVANGRRHWISNKDNWKTWEGCRRPTDTVHCMSLAEVNSVPDGGPIDLPTCRARRGP
jgi:hypothetical protein